MVETSNNVDLLITNASHLSFGVGPRCCWNNASNRFGPHLNDHFHALNSIWNKIPRPLWLQVPVAHLQILVSSFNFNTSICHWITHKHTLCSWLTFFSHSRSNIYYVWSNDQNLFCCVFFLLLLFDGDKMNALWLNTISGEFWLLEFLFRGHCFRSNHSWMKRWHPIWFENESPNMTDKCRIYFHKSPLKNHQKDVIQ